MVKVALPPKSTLLALLMLVMIIFPKPLFCEATQQPHRELLQSGGTICPDCLCCEDPRPSVRSTSCCACCSTPRATTNHSDKGFKGTGWSTAMNPSVAILSTENLVNELVGETTPSTSGYGSSMKLREMTGTELSCDDSQNQEVLDELIN